ncbi:MAG TPA: DUF1501 domain-containing protein [Verrucomicrobiales bacterium]|nr:DUF1501 domain-containing protein [Verrucomicrobiales bacterium]
MNMNFTSWNRRGSRRRFLNSCAAATLGSAGLLSSLARAASLGEAQVLAPRAGHHPAKARQLLFVFLTGGFSHVDTFDPKPRLTALSGQPVPAFGLRADEAKAQPLLGSPFEFRRCGRSGLPISDLFPRLRTVADDLCVIRTLHTDIVEHFQATLAMHTGSSTIPLPSLGAWMSYGLGTLNPNLPSFVVLAEHLPYAGAQIYDAGFLPPHHQGVRIIPGEDPVPNLRPIEQRATLAELEARMLRDVNERHAEARPGDLSLRARIQTTETARGMMREAPGVFDLSREHPGTLASYGVAPGDRSSFAWQCLMARRMIERGIRVVELVDTGSHDNWDSHGDMQAHRPKALRVDQALTALIDDLKQRGLFEETLMVICTEFGRTPWTDASNGKGRNHFAKAFSCLLAGAGVRGGTAYGATDELGANIVESPVHVHDYHATILHLMGFDHTRLTYRYAGRDFRLTDISGEVVRGVLS